MARACRSPARTWRRCCCVPILDLDLSGITTSIKRLRVTVSGVRATLTAEAAGALNQAFGTTAFQEGLLLGTATVRARL